MNGKNNMKLTTKQQEILNNIKMNPYIIRKEISEEIKISITSVSNNLKKLVEKGYVERIGSDKNGYWKTLK